MRRGRGREDRVVFWVQTAVEKQEAEYGCCEASLKKEYSVIS